MKKPLRDFNVGEEVTITAVVASKSDNSVTLWFPGVGASGRWAMKENTRAQPGGDSETRSFIEGMFMDRFGDG